MNSPSRLMLKVLVLIAGVVTVVLLGSAVGHSAWQQTQATVVRNRDLGFPWGRVTCFSYLDFVGSDEEFAFPCPGTAVPIKVDWLLVPGSSVAVWYNPDNARDVTFTSPLRRWRAVVSALVITAVLTVPLLLGRKPERPAKPKRSRLDVFFRW